jgi:hypothetical protein
MSKITVCAVCGKPIDANESRFVDTSVLKGTKIHVHTGCKQ